MPRKWGEETFMPPFYRQDIPPCTCSPRTQIEELPKTPLRSCINHSNIVLQKPLPNQFAGISTPNSFDYKYTDDLEQCYIYEHRTNRDDLLQSAEAGCQLCSYLYGRIFGFRAWKIPKSVVKNGIRSIILASQSNHWPCDGGYQLMLYVDWVFVDWIFSVANILV
jgi:hypothetical protein